MGLGEESQRDLMFHATNVIYHRLKQAEGKLKPASDGPESVQRFSCGVACVCISLCRIRVDTSH